MATKKSKSRLAEIYKAEKARGGGVASTLGKRALEKFDPRQFFNQDSFLAAVLPSLFKAYKVDTKATPETLAPSLSPAPTIGNVEVVNELSVIKTDTKINAKNSMVLPAMARDMNLMRQNIAKLVKAQGEKPAYKADMFFKRASEREAEYESKFKKEGGKKTAAPTTTTAAPASKTGGLLSGLVGGLGKGLGIASLGAGIAGFLAAIGGAAYVLNQVGGSAGLKDLLVNLAEGLNAFSGQSLLALGALLGTGMLFGSVTGLSSKGGAVLGITAIGLGIGGFMAGLSAGGALSEMIGGSAGVKNMLVNLAEGLSAFSSTSLVALGALLGAGGLFGVVTGVAAPAGLAMMGGTMLGMTAIGLGLGGFLSALSLGGAGVNLFGGASGVKDMMVALAEGLNAFTNLDAGNLAKLALAIPAFGVGMLAFFGLQGLGGIVKAFSDGMKGVTDWIFGNKADKTPLQQLSEDLKLFSNVNGDNLSKVGQGLKDLASGMLGLSQLKPEDLQKVQAATAMARTIAGTTTTPAPAPSPAQEDTLKRLGIAPSTAGGGRGSINPPMVSPTQERETGPIPQTGPKGEFNNKKDFLTAMYPLAVKASEQLGGIDPNALLTQWGVESAWGTKTSGKYNYFGIKADKGWNGPKEDVMTHEVINGERIRIPQPFRSYSSPEEAVNDYVSFLKTNKRYERAGVFQAQTSSDFFGALQKAGYATDPNYAAKLTSLTASTAKQTAYLSPNMAATPSMAPATPSMAPATPSMAPATPSTGTVLASATTETSTARMQLASAAPVIVNAPTTNNVQQGGGGMQRVAQYTSPSSIDTEFAKLVSRVV